MPLHRSVVFLLLFAVGSSPLQAKDDSRSAGSTFLRQSWSELLVAILSDKDDGEVTRMLRISRFVGRLEGHMETKAPRDWLRGLFTMKRLSNDYWCFEKPALRQVHASIDGGYVRLSQGPRSAHLPRDAFEDLSQHRATEGIAFATSKSHTLVAKYDNYTVTPLRIRSFGPSSTKEWQFDKELIHRVPVSSGGFHALYLKVADGYLYVFGIEFNGLYVAKVDLENGKLIEFFDACL